VAFCPTDFTRLKKPSSPHSPVSDDDNNASPHVGFLLRRWKATDVALFTALYRKLLHESNCYTTQYGRPDYSTYMTWLVGWLVGEKFVELRGRGLP